MEDIPIAFTVHGTPIYDNTPTVVAMLVHIKSGILVITRANNPGRGLLGLPGGYHMRGETWQQAGAREVLEETGYEIDPEQINLVSMETDEYGNNLVIAEYRGPVLLTDIPIDGEASDVTVMLTDEIGKHFISEDKFWAFPRHYRAAVAALK